jgi:hypothetical protein
MVMQAMQAKQKLQQAQATHGAQREKMMAEHMKMMKEVMVQMQTSQPATSISPTEREAWMAEHKKPMAEMMEQMMTEHRMMMRTMPSQAGTKSHSKEESAMPDQHKH